jgi:tRNA-dihydrouridine synthase
VNERVDESDGFRHLVVDGPRREAKGRERWVINKVRALCSWYSKGIDSGSYLRVRVNSASTLQELREIIEEFFLECVVTAVPGVSGERLCG